MMEDTLDEPSAVRELQRWGAAFLFVAGFTWLFHLWLPQSRVADLLFNLVPEFLGAAVTLFVVDLGLERHRAQERARELAWELLGELHHVVWIWLGGARHPGTYAISKSLQFAHSQDAAMIDPVKRLFEELAWHADHLLCEDEILAESEHLRNALRHLTTLSSATLKSEEEATRSVAEAASMAVRHLALVLGHPTRLPKIRHEPLLDPSEPAQKRRLDDQVVLIPLSLPS